MSALAKYEKLSEQEVKGEGQDAQALSKTRTNLTKFDFKQFGSDLVQTASNFGDHTLRALGQQQQKPEDDGKPKGPQQQRTGGPGAFPLPGQKPGQP